MVLMHRLGVEKHTTIRPAIKVTAVNFKILPVTEVLYTTQLSQRPLSSLPDGTDYHVKSCIVEKLPLEKLLLDI